ncbi:MAG: FecR domain-containing protein [Deltaproteobacteria bacterium]|nr:FecR domain-containing protein [Deltaproteobacteria bacterium]
MVVLHEKTNQAYFAAQGDTVFQHDALFTLEESRCRVRFISEDVITMGKDARIEIEELVDDHELQKKKSNFSMARGKAMFYVVRLFRHKNVSASVKTKTAVAKIRGTKFGVEVRKASGRLAQSKPLYIADASDSGLFYLAQANNDTETVVHGFEGIVDVLSTIDKIIQTVTKGQSLLMTMIGAGVPQPTDPAAAQQFMEETEAPPPGEAPAEEKKKAVEKEAAAPATTDTIYTVDTVDTTEVTQDQTAISVEEAAPTTEIRPTEHYGYFSSMLTNTSNSLLKDVYASSERQDFDSSEVEATGIAVTTGYMRANPDSGFSSPYLTEVDVGVGAGPTNSGALDLSYTISHTELGYNAYQEWGYWTMTAKPVEIDGTNYYVDNKGYYIMGDYTPDAAVPGVSGTYSGNAWGTYWSLAGGTDMTGTFSCSVNGAAGTVTNFDLDLAGGVHTATIDGNGTFIAGTSDFSLQGATYEIDGSTATSGALAGGLYGPNGEYIGGAGGIYYDPTLGYAGDEVGVDLLFQGSQ